ncbi:NUDIX hydrolase domain-like protein [Irpex rosettiformis]|uniref:NUDIX hydrolase domain-like protein n=1 Tax=Irpex rosettiformis TaxID=378272 RepID=A0ACB8U534_9APHY|nr:NUDIX hydrolase domain-like protein [Irpex rosettiformis]
MALGKGRRKDYLLDYHRPRIRLDKAPLPPLKPESRQCLHNLVQYVPPTPKMKYPKSRQAAVLVALFVGRMGDLYVLLSQRSSNLRSYAGDTSLPGGKREPNDRTIEWTARREAFEEIGLPLDKRKVPLLCLLEPFLAGSNLIVTPVVVLVLDNTIRPILNEAEVSLLFSHPLAALLKTETPSTDPAMLEFEYYTHNDLKEWIGLPGTYRMHRFLTGREAGGTKPIYGLTAAILIWVAVVGYGRRPDFDLFAPGQWSHEQRVAYVMKHNPVLREAQKKEGIDPNKNPDVHTFPGPYLPSIPPSIRGRL